MSLHGKVGCPCVLESTDGFLLEGGAGSGAGGSSFLGSADSDLQRSRTLTWMKIQVKDHPRRVSDG